MLPASGVVRPLLQACHRGWGVNSGCRRAQLRAYPVQASAGPAAMSTAATGATWAQVLQRYDEAQAQHASSSIETNTQLLEDPASGVAFILKIAAKLRDKPKPPAPSGDEAPQAQREWRNPFLPYDEALWVQHLSPTHTLLLNKFNVVPHHLLVVTRAFESQLDPLNAADMEATWALMQCMPSGGLAFYNCGPESGASQPHKHVQLVPLPLDGASATAGGEGPSGSSDGSGGNSGDSTADPGPPIWAAIRPQLQGAQPWQPVDLTGLPFAAFAVALPPAEDVTPQLLAGAFAALLARCRGFVAAAEQPQQQTTGGSPAGAAGSPAGSAAPAGAGDPFSYNMLFTRRFLMLVPRAAEADGPVSCNSVAFAGSFFVRSREEVEYVRERGPMRVLAAVGLPWPAK